MPHVPQLEKLANVWLIEIGEKKVLLYRDGREESYNLGYFEDGSLYQPDWSDREQVADVLLADGAVIGIAPYREKVHGVILSADENSVEVEGYGHLPLASDYKGYRIYDTLSMCTYRELAFGYDFADLVLKNGEVCGILMVREETMEEIRVLIKTSDFGGNLFITEGVGNVGVQTIKEKTEAILKAKRKPPVVIIDYLQILAPFDLKMTDKQNTDKNVLELKRLSRDYGVPILGISSFNRDNYTAPVNMASFKESGAIEYSSDVLIGLQYYGMDYQKGESEAKRRSRVNELLNKVKENGKAGKPQAVQVKVLKNRNGAKGDFCLDCLWKFNYFIDKAAEAQAQEDKGSRSDNKKPEDEYAQGSIFEGGWMEMPDEDNPF